MRRFRRHFGPTKLDWELENETIAVNVSGFTATANVAVAHLAARGSGCLVGISSIAALRGNPAAPAYGASLNSEELTAALAAANRQRI